ncbi:MAG: ATP-binding protein [Lachnospiraceae bacterium]
MNCTYSDSNQKKIELYSVFIYSLYTIVLVMMSVRREGNPWTGIVMTCAILAAWIVYVGKFWTYQLRAAIYVLIMQFILILHASKFNDFARALPVLLVFVVLVSLYGIAELIYIPAVGILLVFLIHVFVTKSFANGDVGDVYTAIALLLNAALLERVMYTSTRMNREGSRQLLGVIEELEKVEQSKDDFLANVSHEIRTPLNTICGMSELLLQKELSDSMREDIQSIQTSGRMLMSVVSDILDFSELLSGKMELAEEAYSITSTINDVINMTKARKGEKPIELIVDCDANLPCALLGDEKKLRRVIMNLIDNAIKFTDEGCVCLTIGCRRETYGINLVISVKDTGIGMDEKNQEKLFASFNQADTGRNRQKDGIGLGLAISRALVQKMGGAITVKSRLGKGTLIKFAVPQKVLDERPIAAIRNKEEINVAIYIDMEQFITEMVRDEYDNCIVHMVEQLKGRCHTCRNLAELQRREKRESFSHVFISVTEYKADREYFDELAERTKLVVVLGMKDDKYVTNPKVLKIYKPFYILTIVSVLNGAYASLQDGKALCDRRFTTKDAHVLVVDDNRMNIMVIEALLATYNIKVTTAFSGKEALTKIASEDYDFVFMDHMMPEMDGVETLHRIRQMVGSYYRKVPVIALTANAVAGAREMFLSEGFQDFLEKPVERSVLERVLKRTLNPEKLIFMDESSGNNAESVPRIEAENTAELPPAECIGNTSGGMKVPESSEMTEILRRHGLDAKSGLMYCNGKEQYVKILQSICTESDDPATLVEQLFQKQDWTNYTIAVHGIKGAMRSIGAMKVSELAKELEFAGREERTAYILEHHAVFIEEYRKLLEELRKEEWLYPAAAVRKEKADRIRETELKVLDGTEFEQRIEQMENAVYALDEETIHAVVSELQKCKYHDVALSAALGPVKKKVEGAAYMSAVELLAKLKKALDEKEGG